MNTDPSNLPRRIAIIVALVLLVLGITYLVIGAKAAGELTTVDHEGHDQFDKTPAAFGVEYEDVRFQARDDDLQLAAWYLPRADSSRALILIHGRNASKQDAISGTIVDLGAALQKSGFAVLMIDLRGHEDSEGERYSFGFYERLDVLGAVDWLKDKGFEDGSIGVLGISLGGGATIAAASEETAIGALVVESTFSELYPLILEQWESESGLPNYFLPGVFLMNRIIYGYDLASIRPVDQIVQVAPRPVFIMHCTADDLVNVSHAYQLAEAVPHAETLYFDDCDHAEIHRDYPEQYQQAVISFFDHSLK